MKFTFVDELPPTNRPAHGQLKYSDVLEQLRATGDQRWAVLRDNARSTSGTNKMNKAYPGFDFATRRNTDRSDKTYTIYVRVKPADIVQDRTMVSGEEPTSSAAWLRDNSPAAPALVKGTPRDKPVDLTPRPRVLACLEPDCTYEVAADVAGKTLLRRHAMDAHNRPATADELRPVVA